MYSFVGAPCPSSSLAVNSSTAMPQIMPSPFR
jgi:hypothetical protein